MGEMEEKEIARGHGRECIEFDRRLLLFRVRIG